MLNFFLNWEKPEIGPSHDPVTWYKITHTGEKVAQWDFQNNARAFVLEVPLCNSLTSVCNFVPWKRGSEGVRATSVRIGCLSLASDIQSETTVSVKLHHQNSVLHDQQARNRLKDATYYLDLGRQLRGINRIGGKISLYCVTSSRFLLDRQATHWLKRCVTTQITTAKVTGIATVQYVSVT